MLFFIVREDSHDGESVIIIMTIVIYICNKDCLSRSVCMYVCMYICMYVL